MLSSVTIACENIENVLHLIINILKTTLNYF